MKPAKARIWMPTDLAIGFAFGLAVAALYWRFGPVTSPWACLGAFVVSWAVGAEGALQARKEQRHAFRK
jgi:hypothetical protein